MSTVGLQVIAVPTTMEVMSDQFEEPIDKVVFYTIECSECGPMGVVTADVQYEFCVRHFEWHERLNGIEKGVWE